MTVSMPRPLPTTTTDGYGGRCVRCVGRLCGDSLEWTDGETVRATTALQAGRYVRLDDSERGLQARYPQLCRGRSGRGNTVVAPGRVGDHVSAEILAAHVARELGVRFYRSDRGYEAAVVALRGSYPVEPA